MHKSIEEIDMRFRSGNSIPVERATVPAQEWTAAKAYIAELEKALRFYSNASQWAGKDHYSSPSQDFPAWTDRSAAEKDRGDIARKALGL